MTDRALKYNTPDFTATRDERIAQLKLELRRHVRSLRDCEILTPEWIRMADSLEQIAKIADMEATALVYNQEEKEKGKKSIGTLWDQEKDEISIRILLEEGKLNLCLRILNKFITVQNSPEFQDKKSKMKMEYDLDKGHLPNICQTFEESCGILLKYAFKHVEALQIVDIPLLVQHCRLVMDVANASQNEEMCSPNQQSSLVLHYLNIICSHLDEMDDERVMDLMEEHNILETIVCRLVDHSGCYQEEEQKAGVQLLSRFLETESYESEPDRFIPNDELKRQFVKLKEVLIDNLSKDLKYKRCIRKLLDNLRIWCKKFPTAN